MCVPPPPLPKESARDAPSRAHHLTVWKSRRLTSPSVLRRPVIEWRQRGYPMEGRGQGIAGTHHSTLPPALKLALRFPFKWDLVKCVSARRLLMSIHMKIHTTQCKRNDRAKAQQLNKALICRQQRVSIFAYTLALSAIRVFESNRHISCALKKPPMGTPFSCCFRTIPHKQNRLL